MEILENFNLQKLNTFNVSSSTKFFVEIENEEELKDLFRNPIFIQNEKFFLGGGSNVLFTQDFNGIVILNKLKGIEIVQEDENNVVIKSNSGETWDDLVSFAVMHNYWGIENLALVPGTVGAAPMQNIGAYGAELNDVLVNVEAYDISSGEKRVFTKEECMLGYRDSVFKNSLRNKYFISAVTLQLSKKEKINSEYKVLKEYLEKNKIEIKSSKDVYDAVCAIRRSKLPDPKVLGNAGSFFKNVFLEKEKFEELSKLFPEMPHFEEDNKIKVPTAYFIEQCGWKGKRVGNVGVHDKQALVLINHGGASGEDIKSLAREITRSVFDKFKVVLTTEVNLL